jgi:hypothetical protein
VPFGQETETQAPILNSTPAHFAPHGFEYVLPSFPQTGLSSLVHMQAGGLHPTVFGYFLQYAAGEIPAAHARHSAVKALQHGFGSGHPTVFGNFLQYAAGEIPAAHDRHSAVMALQHGFGSGLGHPTVLGFSLQNSSSETPASQERHSAVKALQQGLGPSSQPFGKSSQCLGQSFSSSVIVSFLPGV